MLSDDLPVVIKRLKKVTKDWPTPVVTKISYALDPFKVLISCLLSLRTRDEITRAASERLFYLADTPQKVLQLDLKTVEKVIYPVAFYRNKAFCLFEICRDLIDDHNGNVPKKLDQLLKLKGVGRKTANLTLILGHSKYGICVDTHVHRISNRWGYVKTNSPDETEMVLREKLPKRYWMKFNELLVSFGQNMCKAQSPYCSKCFVIEYCAQSGVKNYR